MRILFVSRLWPDRNGNGAERRAAQHLDTLTRLGAVTLVLPHQAKARYQQAGADPAVLGVERVLIRGDRTRYDQREQALHATRNKALRGWRRLRTRHPNDQRALADDIAYQRRAIGEGYDVLFAFRLASAIWIDSVLAAQHRPPVTICDFDDIESIAFARMGKMRAYRNLFDHWQIWSFTRWLAAMESRIARRWSAAVVCSAHDRDSCRARLDIAPLVVPNSVAFPPPAPPPPALPCELLFVGLLNYPPNVQGACWLAREVWPTVRDHLGPNARLTIAGMNPNAEVRDLATIPGVEVLASVPDLAPLYARATICVAPIFAGGGTRIKVIEAMSQTRPIISTTIGCEGLTVEAGRELVIADTPTAFAAATLELTQDPVRSRALAEAGWTFGQTHYARETVIAAFTEAIAALVAQR